MEMVYSDYGWRRLKDFVVGDIIFYKAEELEVTHVIPYKKIVTLYFYHADGLLDHITEHKKNRHMSKMREGGLRNEY